MIINRAFMLEPVLRAMIAFLDFSTYRFWLDCSVFAANSTSLTANDASLTASATAGPPSWVSLGVHILFPVGSQECFLWWAVV